MPRIGPAKFSNWLGRSRDRRKSLMALSSPGGAITKELRRSHQKFQGYMYVYVIYIYIHAIQENEHVFNIIDRKAHAHESEKSLFIALNYQFQ